MERVLIYNVSNIFSNLLFIKQQMDSIFREVTYHFGIYALNLIDIIIGNILTVKKSIFRINYLGLGFAF